MALVIPNPAGQPRVDEGCTDPDLEPQSHHTQGVETATRDKQELHGAPSDDEQAEADSTARSGEDVGHGDGTTKQSTKAGSDQREQLPHK